MGRSPRDHHVRPGQAVSAEMPAAHDGSASAGRWWHRLPPTPGWKGACPKAAVLVCTTAELAGRGSGRRPAAPAAAGVAP